MKFALDTCIHGEYSNPILIAELASLAEQSGWDGFFIWDGMGGTQPTADPWVTLSVMGSFTSKIRIGTAVTPIARRRPWKLARETTSVDCISKGRLTLGVGLGDPPSTEYQQFGENPNSRTRADKLDEGLDVLTGLWGGKEFSYDGNHYKIDKVTFLPIPVQSPRIPIWVAGDWPRNPPFRRAARWDGMIPIKNDGTESTDMTSEMPVLTPHDIEHAVIFTKSHRVSKGPIDVVTGVQNSMMSRSELGRIAAEYEDAGLTWQTHSFGPWNGTIEECRARIRQGPPTM